VKNTERIVDVSMQSLNDLEQAVQTEIADLRRFKQNVGGVDVYMYADRIARREEILKEIDGVKARVRLVGENATAFGEFYLYLRAEKEFCQIGEGNGFIDVVRYFYKETVKKYKYAYNMQSKRMYKSDAYALCVICANLAERLSPVFSYVFVDEAQDISSCEYDLLRKINKKASFNVFGDIAQNVTSWRGVSSWQTTFPDFEIYTLDQNYRNTNQIVRYVSKSLGIDMQPIGFDGAEVSRISVRGISAYFKEKKGLKAIICTEEQKERLMRKSYHDLGIKQKVSRSKINIMTVYESKGLELSSVVVVANGMNKSEKYIACTRALNELAVIWFAVQSTVARLELPAW
jgi:ribosomal protein L20A (L18A)